MSEVADSTLDRAWGHFFDEDRTRGWPQDPRDEFQQGSFARTVGSDQYRGFPGRELEG